MLLTDKSEIKIKSWKQFARHVRSKGCQLLARLDDFPESVLVTGCQRSGTTILARTITGSAGMVDYRFGKDDELDAALILSGNVKHENRGRHCFQTTYLNECYREYNQHRNGHKVIWVVRNPFSVIYSLVYHWKRFAFNELFDACGIRDLSDRERRRYERFGSWGISKIRRACHSYNGKTQQLFELYEMLSGERMLVVDYSDITQRKEECLPKVFDFIDQPYDTAYGDNIHSDSVDKASRLSDKERNIVQELCVPIYERAKDLVLA